jgi:hypothetical protein
MFRHTTLQLLGPALLLVLQQLLWLPRHQKCWQLLLVRLLMYAWLLELCCNALRAPVSGNWDCCCACCCSP